jgi:hypothetical protein
MNLEKLEKLEERFEIVFAYVVLVVLASYYTASLYLEKCKKRTLIRDALVKHVYLLSFEAEGLSKESNIENIYEWFRKYTCDSVFADKIKDIITKRYQLTSGRIDPDALYKNAQDFSDTVYEKTGVDISEYATRSTDLLLIQYKNPTIDNLFIQVDNIEKLADRIATVNWTRLSHLMVKYNWYALHKEK